MINLENIPITKKEFNLVKKSLKKYTKVNYYYLKSFEKLWSKNGLTKEYPLVYTCIIYNGRPNPFIRSIDNLIIFHENSKTKGFKRIIKESENKQDFYHSLSQLESAKYFINKGFKVELIGSGKGKKPDLLIEKNNLKIYIEIKTLREEEFLGLLINSVYDIKSDFMLSITKHPNCTNQAQIIKFKKEVKKRLKNSKGYDLSKPLEIKMNDNLPPFATVEFIKDHKKPKNTITPSLAKSEVIVVDSEQVKEKLREIMYSATEQLYENYKNFPKFILFDLKNSNLPLVHYTDEKDFGEMLYAKRLAVADPMLNKKISDKNRIKLRTKIKERHIKDYKINQMDKICFKEDFKKTCGEYLISREGNNLKGFILSGIIQKKGIYFGDYYHFLNGIMMFTSKKFFLFPNPFIDKNLLINENKLVELFF